jgi:TonB family protein
MKISPQKNISLSVSLFFHAVFVVVLVFSIGKKDKEQNQFIEVNFGGGGNGLSYSGNTNEKKEVVKVIKKDVIIENKTKKVVQQTPVTEKKETETGNGEGNGTGNGSGNGEGNGTGLTLNIPTPNKEVHQESTVYFVAVEEMPEPIGGIESILSKINISSTIHGTVYVLAFVDENGVVRRVLLAKGIGGGCDEAALNAVKRTRFKPGKKNGEAVKVQMHIAVPF